MNFESLPAPVRTSCRPTIAAVRAYATVGEVVGVLREVHGSWTASPAF